MYSLKKTLSVLTVLTLLSGQIAFADTAEIEKRLADLEQQVAILKRQLEVEKEESAKKTPETPIVTANAKDGFSIKSPDESFKLKIRGLVQADSRTFTSTTKEVSGTTDTFLVRRARPIFEGTVNKNFDFYLVPDFGNGTPSLIDAFADLKFAPAFKLRGGKSKVPIGLERLQSDAVINFTESGLPTNLVPNRDVGFQLMGDVLNESASYAVGIFNGVADLGTLDGDTNNDKDLAARFFILPFKNKGPEGLKGLGVGLGGSYGHKEGSTLPTYKSPGQVNVFSYASGVSADGAHTRLSPQAYYYNGSFGLLGEYVTSTQKVTRTSGGIIRDDVTNDAWQLSANYVLTGELASYKGVVPRTNFEPSEGTWGAFEVVARYGQLKIDSSAFNNGFASHATSISRESSMAAGLNWYLNRNVRLMLDFEHTDFKNGALTGDRIDENVISSRIQLAF
jgi:phosphate-selective porin OprO and OprP